jgi:hypothetical protein
MQNGEELSMLQASRWWPVANRFMTELNGLIDFHDDLLLAIHAKGCLCSRVYSRLWRERDTQVICVGWLWFVPGAVSLPATGSASASHHSASSPSSWSLVDSFCWRIGPPVRLIVGRRQAITPTRHFFPRQNGDWSPETIILSWLCFYPWTHGTPLVFTMVLLQVYVGVPAHVIH